MPCYLPKYQSFSRLLKKLQNQFHIKQTLTSLIFCKSSVNSTRDSKFFMTFCKSSSAFLTSEKANYKIWHMNLQHFFLTLFFFLLKCTVLIYVLLHFVCDLCILYATLQLIKFRTTNVFLNIDHGTRFQMLHGISKFLYSNCLVHLCYHTLSNISQQFA